MWVFIAVVTVALTFWTLRSPALKGRVGERRLRRKVKSVLRGSNYRFLHDLTLKDYDGTAQIDHVLISPAGVFVIETKNYGGWIYGSADQRSWTHTFHRRKYQFQNPLRQNYNHLKAVQDATKVQTHQIHSLVVFVGNGKFKTQMPENVVRLKGLKRYFRNNSDVFISNAQIESIANRLEKRRLKRGFLTNWRHRRHIKEVLRRPDCPRCDKRMVVRTAKRGPNAGSKFWGCARYPKCQGTRPRQATR